MAAPPAHRTRDRRDLAAVVARRPLALLLGAAVRFLHFALFGGTLFSLPYYVADTAVCLASGLIGFRLMRVAQMVTCYGWINERRDLYTWRRRGTSAGGA